MPWLRTAMIVALPGHCSTTHSGAAQGLDLAGGHATGIGLHHHREEGFIDPAALLEPFGEKLPLLSRGMARVRSPTWVVSIHSA